MVYNIALPVLGPGWDVVLGMSSAGQGMRQVSICVSYIHSQIRQTDCRRQLTAVVGDTVGDVGARVGS
jgi:hypothetical protein